MELELEAKEAQEATSAGLEVWQVRAWRRVR
jgi:hypothetical protein